MAIKQMITQKQKIAVISLAVVVLLAGGYLIFKKFVWPTPSESPKTASGCQQDFKFSKDKIDWAVKNQSLGFLTDYFSCQAAISEDHKICEELNFGNEKDMAGNKKVCQKAVLLKQVLAPLAGGREASSKNVSDLQLYLDNYSNKDSVLNKTVSRVGIQKFLAAYSDKDVSVCDGLEYEGDCKSFISKDEKYCDSDSSLDKQGCILGAKLMRAIDEGDVNRCGQIEEDGNILAKTCFFALNEDEKFCASNKNLNDFIVRYCALNFSNLQP